MHGPLAVPADVIGSRCFLGGMVDARKPPSDKVSEGGFYLFDFIIQEVVAGIGFEPMTFRL